jgi:hypothetical protein
VSFAHTCRAVGEGTPRVPWQWVWLTPCKIIIDHPFFVAIALVGILSGIFLFALSLLLFHILLQRRKAKAKSSRPPHGAPGAHNHQQASSWSSFSFPSRRRSRRSRSDSESDVEGEEEDDSEKINGSHGSRASSIYLEPNQPLYVDVDVDVESESNDRGPHPGMQFILTPPTPGK